MCETVCLRTIAWVALPNYRHPPSVPVAGYNSACPVLTCLATTCERAAASLGRDRIVERADEVVAQAPDIVIGSWCGKKFRAEQVRARPGWADVPAVRDGELHEIKSPLILQPGPAALTDGLAALHSIIARWSARTVHRS